MGPSLPEISCLSSIPSARWSEFGDRLRAIGLNTRYVNGICRSGFRSFDSLQLPLITWHARLLEEPPGYVYRMFGLRDPIRDHEAVEALGRTFVEELIDSGVLVRPQPGRIVSIFELRVFEDLFILCDDLSHKGEAVFGAGRGTAAFCRAIPRREFAGNALDLGCGAGAAALWVSRYARRVLATDINPRVLAFFQVNAAVNRVSNVEVRLGNLFEPVSGETFDLIISQPPTVPSPPGAPRATYLHGGPLGSELPWRIVSELPPFLSPDGRAIIVFEKPVFAGPIGPRHVAEPRLNENMRALLLLGAEVDADAYSIRYAAPELRRGADEFDQTVMKLRDHLRSQNIRGMCPAVWVLEHAPRSAGWTETVRGAHSLWEEISAGLIHRLISGHVLIR